MPEGTASEAAKKINVSEETIRSIREMGMAAALKKWATGSGSEEFNEAVTRYYGEGHRKKAKEQWADKSETKSETPKQKEGPAVGKKPHELTGEEGPVVRARKISMNPNYRGDVPKGSPAVMDETAAKGPAFKGSVGKKLGYSKGAVERRMKNQPGKYKST